MEKPVVQSLWLGGAMSTLERLSIKSFIATGHHYSLYVYDAVDGVPSGVELCDADAIVSRSVAGRYDSTKYGIFSDLFRFALLSEKGGWWVDTDVVALRRFAFDSEYVFAAERDYRGRECLTSGIIRAPKGSRVMHKARRLCERMDLHSVAWGSSGPDLLHGLLLRSRLNIYIQPAEVFCPISPNRWLDALLPLAIPGLEAASSVHLWNEMWRRYGLDKNREFAPGSIFERLKREYL